MDETTLPGALPGRKKWARGRGIPTNLPWRQLTAEQRRLILEGDPENDYQGVKGFFTWLERKKYKLHVRVFLSRFRGYATCPDCGGTRLRAEARAVRVAGKAITEICKLSVKEARAFFSSLQLSEGHQKIADRILEEIRTRLQFLDEVGLDYLTLNRLTSTLSGGESQRIQLATSLGSHLVGALYVLDEPSIGLHPRDTQRLIDILNLCATWGTPCWLWNTIRTPSRLRIASSIWAPARANSAASCCLQALMQPCSRNTNH